MAVPAKKLASLKKPSAPVPCDVKNLALAEKGRGRIEWSGRSPQQSADADLSGA